MQNLKSFRLILLSVLILFLAAYTLKQLATEDPNMTGLKLRTQTPFIAQDIHFHSEYLGMSVFESWNEDGDQGVVLNDVIEKSRP